MNQRDFINRDRIASSLTNISVVLVLFLCTGHFIVQEHIGKTTLYPKPENDSDTYLMLLEKAGDDLPEAEERLVRRHVAQMILLLPEQFLRHVVNGKVRTVKGRLYEDWRIKPGAGKLLVAWWQAQDPLPGTPRNERLEEHLERVAYAKAHYAAKTLCGWDDRGLVYVRLGAPSTQRSVRFSDARLLRILEKTSAPIRLQDFPDNEIWVYDEIEESAYYLFVEQDGFYMLASSEALLPRSLRLVSGRRTNLLVGKPPPTKTEVLLEAMRVIYGALAPYHPDFSQAYLEVADYVESGDVEQLGISVRTMSEGVLQPHMFATRQLNDTQGKEELATLRREEVIPRQRSKFLDDVPAFPVVVRAARFLDSDGSTRTEIYWSVPTATGLNYRTFERFLLDVTTVQRKADYTTRITQRNRQVVRTALTADSESVLPAQTLILRGDTAVYHVAVQWDQYPLTGEGYATRKAIREPVRRGVFRADSLQALSTRQDVLEMSDLVPIVVSRELDFNIEGDNHLAIQPYPFSMIVEGDSVGLYFEVYHLAFGADDQTHFIVEYEVQRREAGGIVRLFRDKKERTSARTRYVGNARTAREWIQLELDEWAEAADLEIVVRITDETTRRVAERSIRFALAKSGQ